MNDFCAKTTLNIWKRKKQKRGLLFKNKAILEQEKFIFTFLPAYTQLLNC